MVIDTSALLAILGNEPERHCFNLAISADDTRLLSVASLVEATSLMQARYGDDGVRQLDLFLSRADIELVSVDTEQAYLARQAFRQYGQGRHPAALNLGDCFTYALAKIMEEPLLFKGDDFSHTDLAAVADTNGHTGLTPSS